MRRLTPIVLSLALIASCAAAATAQRRRPRPRPASSAAKTTAPAEQGATILVERDPEEGTTTVKLETLTVEHDKAAKTQLLLAAHFKQGANGAAPAFVHLTLFSRAPRCRFPPQADLELALDGAPVALKFQPDSSTTATTASMEVVTVFVPKAEGVLWVQRETAEGGDCSESLAATLSPQTFARMAAARAVALKIGTATFSLKPNALAALRDLGGRMKKQ
jgi:hypothetical protein